jgi:hypothetical protein
MQHAKHGTLCDCDGHCWRIVRRVLHARPSQHRGHRRQVGATTISRNRRFTTLPMAGFYCALGIQHTKWKLSPRTTGAEMVFSQIRLVADALFYFLRWRLRHSRQLRDLSSRPSGIARMYPAASTKRCHLIRACQRAYARDEYPRYRGSANVVRQKMAVAILAIGFFKTRSAGLCYDWIASPKCWKFVLAVNSVKAAAGPARTNRPSVDSNCRSRGYRQAHWDGMLR